MSQDNGIQIDVDFSKMVVRSEDPDKVLGVKSEQLSDFSTTKVSSDGEAGSAFISSFLSSVSSNDDVNLFSKQILDISETANRDQEEARTISTMRKASGSLIEASITEFVMPSNVTGVLSELGPLVNSTTSTTMMTANGTLEHVHVAKPWSSEEIGAVTLVSLMVPFILISNFFVIISVVRFRRLHTPTNYFITSLASVDIFVALAVPFVVVVEVFHFGGAISPGEVVVCLLPNRVLMMTCGVSMLTLAAIAYDRHTALVSPLEYINIMTTRKVAIMVSLTWIYSAIIVWLPLVAGWYDVPADAGLCSANLMHGKAPILFLSAIFVPSCIAILVCYFRIFMVARHHAKAIAAVEFAVHRRLQVKFMIKDTKYAKTLAMVIGVFLALWLPYLICIFIKLVSAISFGVWVQTYLILLAVFNSGINPWIYAFKNNEFKAAFKRMFKDFCREKFCQTGDRRASLVSAISSTPRLSRTDSRIVSIIPEGTVDTVCDRLKRSLDSLDECERELEIGKAAYDCAKRRQTIAEEIPAVSSASHYKQSRRQAASCTDLDCAKRWDIDKYDVSRIHRSISMDFILPTQSTEDMVTSRESLHDSGIFNQISIEDVCNTDTLHMECDTNPSRHLDIHHSHRPKRVLSMPSYTPSTFPLYASSSSSLPSSPIHIKPPPPSPRRSQPAKRAPSSVSRSQHHHRQAQQQTTSASAHHHTSLPRSPSTNIQRPTPSFCDASPVLRVKSNALRSDLCTDSSAAFHPYFENVYIPSHCTTSYSDTVSAGQPSSATPAPAVPDPHMLHTQSYPTLESFSAVHPVLAYMSWDGSVVCSPLAERNMVVPLEHGVGYVSRVKSEEAGINNDCYFL